MPFERAKLNLFKETGFPNPFITWDHPSAEPARDSRLGDDEEVLVVELDGLSKAWPLRLIASHHVVADRLGQRELLITF